MRFVWWGFCDTRMFRFLAALLSAAALWAIVYLGTYVVNDGLWRWLPIGSSKMWALGWASVAGLWYFIHKIRNPHEGPVYIAQP